MYHNFQDLITEAYAKEKSIAQLILENEMAFSEKNADVIYEELGRRLDIMCIAAQKALNTPQVMPANLISGQSKTQSDYVNTTDGYLGSALNKMMAYALSCSEVNASMGRICAAPTAGACGIVPAVFSYAIDVLSPPREELLDALLVASGVGAIITKNATVSGAEGGCQAECGSAAAMASAALVTLKGGTPEQVGYAVSISLMNCMGLVCDPVAGLVQLPCSFRNASQSVNAVLSADLALAGQDSLISADDAIETMYRVGKMLPTQLRETSQGGIAVTPSAEKLAKRLAE